MQKLQYIDIKGKKIPIIIRSFKTSKHLKMYFKANVIYVSKPKYVSVKKAMEFVHQNEKFVYDKYIKVEADSERKLKSWESGEHFFYKGEKYEIAASNCNEANIFIKIDEEKKTLRFSYPNTINTMNRKAYIDKGIKKLLKNNTEILLRQKVPYWSNITNIAYNSFKVNDATSKFGSCIPNTKNMHFSSRLIMLPDDKVDAIVVHELCHIIHPNHSKDFYDLVRSYIPNYDEINKWLKQNGKIIIF